MNNYLSSKISKVSTKWLRLAPFIILGSSVFTLNSVLELNYIVKGYLILLEAQLGVVVFYFLLTTVLKKNHNTFK